MPKRAKFLYSYLGTIVTLYFLAIFTATGFDSAQTSAWNSLVANKVINTLNNGVIFTMISAFGLSALALLTFAVVRGQQLKVQFYKNKLQELQKEV